MANFQPLKNYILYCLDRLCETYRVEGPFLDAGCGRGDVSEHLIKKGFHGTAVDASDQAIAFARARLPEDRVKVEQKDLFDASGSYGLIVLFDVLEHIDDDAGVLDKMVSLLNPGGHLVVTVPSNPAREWRWDDEYYGHVRRYTREDIERKLHAAGMELVTAWDFTFPVFWLMRRLYTRFKSNPLSAEQDNSLKTRMSSCRNAWDMPAAGLLSRDSFLWRFVYAVSFRCFRNRVHRGHEMIVLARKRNA